MSKKPKIENCESCGAVCVRNFGNVNAAGDVRSFCSANCRAIGRNKPADAVSRPKTVSAMSSKRKAAKKPDLRPRETDVSKTIGDDLAYTAAYQSRLQSGKVEIIKGKGAKEKRFYMNLCEAGTPDRIAASGAIIFFEIKKLGEIPSPDQKRVQNDLKNNGALVFTVDNYEDYSFIKSELKKREIMLSVVTATVKIIQREIDAEIEKRNKEK